MKNSGILNLSKSAVFIIAGIVVAIFPKLLSFVFYILGALIIGFSVISIISKKSVSKSVIGVLVGIAVIVIPSFLNKGIPLIIGLIALWQGVSFILNGLSIKKYGGYYKITLGIGIALAVISVLMFANPTGTSTLIRIVLGLVLAGIGVVNYLIEKKHGEIINDDGIIDLGSEHFHE